MKSKKEKKQTDREQIDGCHGEWEMSEKGEGEFRVPGDFSKDSV